MQKFQAIRDKDGWVVRFAGFSLCQCCTNGHCTNFFFHTVEMANFLFSSWAACTVSIGTFGSKMKKIDLFPSNKVHNRIFSSQSRKNPNWAITEWVIIFFFGFAFGDFKFRWSNLNEPYRGTGSYPHLLEFEGEKREIKIYISFKNRYTSINKHIPMIGMNSLVWHQMILFWIIGIIQKFIGLQGKLFA